MGDNQEDEPTDHCHVQLNEEGSRVHRRKKSDKNKVGMEILKLWEGRRSPHPDFPLSI